MPRVYNRKGTKNKWTHSQLLQSVEKVKEKELTLRTAAINNGIPRSTLSEHVRGVRKKHYGGGSTILTRDEEHEIVLTWQILAEMGFPLTKDYVEVVVRDYLSSQEGRSGAFGSTGLPGRSWWEGFLSRWPTLVQRKPQHLPKQRAQCATRGSQLLFRAFKGSLRENWSCQSTRFNQPDLKL